MSVEGGKASDQNVVVRIAHDLIATSAADQQVAAVVTNKQVVAGAADENVVATASLDLVVTKLAIDLHGSENLRTDDHFVIAILSVHKDAVNWSIEIVPIMVI